MIDRKTLKWSLAGQFGKPYAFGAKWDLNAVDPQGPVDCSGFTRWGFAQIKINVPEGSTAQHADSTAISAPQVLPGDYGFLQTADSNVEHHVGLVYDEFFMIEARGVIVGGVEAGTVQLRPRKEWEARKDFLGYFRPKSVVAIEGA